MKDLKVSSDKPIVCDGVRVIVSRGSGCGCKPTETIGVGPLVFQACRFPSTRGIPSGGFAAKKWQSGLPREWNRRGFSVSEGMAEFFSNFIWADGTVRPGGLNARALRILQAPIPLETMFDMGRGDIYGGGWRREIRPAAPGL